MIRARSSSLPLVLAAVVSSAAVLAQAPAAAAQNRPRPADTEGVTDEAFEAGWQSGPLATFRLMKLCHPHLKGGGSIVNLASTAAKRWDMSNYGAYAAVKEAIRSLTQAAACEWASDGIRTNVILPHAKSPGLVGWIESSPEVQIIHGRDGSAFRRFLQKAGECNGAGYRLEDGCRQAIHAAQFGDPARQERQVFVKRRDDMLRHRSVSSTISRNVP